MGVNDALDLTPEQVEMVRGLLRTHLPDTTVWAYGSRVTGKANRYSDLDLVTFAPAAHTRQVAELRDAFDESNLPFRVDLFVWDEVPFSFHPYIRLSHVVLQESATGGVQQRA